MPTSASATPPTPSVVWLFFFVAWSAFYLATVAQAEALNAKRRAAEAESAAQAAQVRALALPDQPALPVQHVQLALVAGHGRPARGSREHDPQALDLLPLQPVARPVGGRHACGGDRAPAALPRYRKGALPASPEGRHRHSRGARDRASPGLLLQPLVENAIKYGVSGTRETVALAIRAAEAGPGRFTIEVINSGATASKRGRNGKPDGTGVGLANVCQRHRSAFRFGCEM